MTTDQKETKAYTEFVTLRKLCMRIHNPQVVAAYTHKLDGEDSDNSIAKLLFDNLQIKTQDTFNAMIIRILIFYLLCGRLSVSSTVPMWWAVKKQKFIDQLVISYRPASRRKLAFRKYDPNAELHIPHYNGDDNPQIPSYTVGQQSAKYTLKDESYIMVNASTEEEAIKTVAKLAEYVKVDKRPSGEVLENITTTKRRGRKLALSDRLIVPFLGDYYKKGDQGYVKYKVFQL
jgi:hypothetical protein